MVIDVFESVCLGGNDEMLMRRVNDRLIILGMLAYELATHPGIIRSLLDNPKIISQFLGLLASLFHL